jgi:hypothetical protein
MEKPKGRKVQFGICNQCYQYLSKKGDLFTETYLDACVYHIHTGLPIPFSILEDRYPLHIDYITQQLEIEKFIITHETNKGIFCLPLRCRKHNNMPIYCSNRSLGCSKNSFLEHNSCD